MLEELSTGLDVNMTWEMTQCLLLAQWPAQWRRLSCSVFNAVIFPKSTLVVASIASCFNCMCPHAVTRMHTQIQRHLCLHTHSDRIMLHRGNTILQIGGSDIFLNQLETNNYLLCRKTQLPLLLYIKSNMKKVYMLSLWLFLALLEWLGDEWQSTLCVKWF